MNLPASAACQLRSAGDDLDLTELRELLGVMSISSRKHAPGLLADAAQHRVAHGARLLKDFLEHEMLVAALFGHDRIPQDVRHLALHRVGRRSRVSRTPSAVSTAISPSARKNMSRVWLRIAGTSEATKYSLSPRPITTGGPERAATILSGSEREMTASAKTPVELRAPLLAHRGFQVAVQILLDQVRDDFGVGLGDELVALGLKLLLERQIVLDDAVVHHHDVAGAVAMRVRVLFGGRAVRGPARVADAVGAVERIHRAPPLPGSAACPKPAARSASCRRRSHGDTSRIVSAVFQPLQPVQE